MTTAPQKEYIITEKQLEESSRCSAENCDGGCPEECCPIEIMRKIRSRPYDPAAIQKAERERVLDLVTERIKHTWQVHGGQFRVLFKRDELLKWIAEFRQQPQEK